MASLLPIRHRPNRGFTLVELLVVIAIIGILIALMLPAVMAARNSALKLQCMNNVKQLSLAAQSYESTQKQFPLNWGVVTTVGEATKNLGANTCGQSWLTLLLPAIEAQTLYQQIKLPTPGNQVTLSYQNTDRGINNQDAAHQVVKQFNCPADTHHGTMTAVSLGSGVYGVTNYKAVAGSNWNQGNFKTCKAERKNPATGNPYGGRNAKYYDGLDQGDGPICRNGTTSPQATTPLATSITFNDVRDGASNTFLMGESVPEWCGWSFWFWFDGSTATCAIPLNYRTGRLAADNVTNWQENYSFMSRHSGGANFGFCDGSGRFISEEIDPDVYRAAATIDGGETVKLPD